MHQIELRNIGILPTDENWSFQVRLNPAISRNKTCGKNLGMRTKTSIRFWPTAKESRQILRRRFAH